MPYERSIRQRPLENPGRSIWRYLPFWKFEDMVTGRRLFFNRLRHIITREIDPFEGALAQINFEEPDVNVAWVLRDVLTPGQDASVIEAVKRQYGDPEELLREQEWGRDFTYVNCWYKDEFESQRMWDQYVTDGNGVLVHSSLRGLCDSFARTTGGIFIQPVVYYEPASRTMVPIDPFHTPLYKHATYAHEYELRCFILAPQPDGPYDLQPDNIGYWVPCDVSTLVHRVRVPPGASDDLLARAREVLVKGDLSNVPLERSALEKGTSKGDLAH
jgi:hypothetical protein